MHANAVSPIPGFHHLAGFVDHNGQARLVAWARELCRRAPLVRPVMPNGTPMSVRVTNAGAAGWWSDPKGGYRYTEHHPETGERWPSVPQWLLALGNAALTKAGEPPAPFDCCHVVYYEDDAKLGMHVDRSEQDLEQPVVTISLGSDATFLMGGRERNDPVQRYMLASGDACVMAIPARNWYHSIAKLHPTMGSMLRAGRLSLTIRRAL